MSIDLKNDDEEEVVVDIPVVEGPVNYMNMDLSYDELKERKFVNNLTLLTVDLIPEIRRLGDKLTIYIEDHKGEMLRNLHDALGERVSFYYNNPKSEWYSQYHNNVKSMEHVICPYSVENLGNIKFDVVIFSGDTPISEAFEICRVGGIFAGQSYHRRIDEVKQFRREMRFTDPMVVTGAGGFWWKKSNSVEKSGPALTPFIMKPKKNGSHLNPDDVRKYGLHDVFVETGTYLGETIELMQPLPFREIWSCDINEGMVTNAKQKFSDDKRIIITERDSADWFPEVVDTLDNDNLRATFWLDAHASGPLKGGRSGGSPLLDELKAIKASKRNDHTIIIDDKRLFGSAEWSYVQYSDAMSLLTEINPEYKFEFLDGQVPGDIICAYI